MSDNSSETSDNDDTDERDDETPPKPSYTKCLTRKQNFSERWLTDKATKGWVAPVPRHKEQAKCVPCNKILSAKYSLLIKHANSVKHIQKASTIKSNQDLVHMLKKSSDGDRDTKTAVLRNCLLIAEHNISIRTIDHIIEIQKHSYKDSKIVSDVILKRTKCTIVIKNALAQSIKEGIKGEVQNKKISILLDESTDISCTKLLAVLVRYVQNSKIKTTLLDLMEVNNASAKGLFSLLKICLNEFNIDTCNIVGFCADNASVKQYLINSNKNLITNGCICHTIHLIVVAAARNIPDKVENLLQNISSYFSRSPKRQHTLLEFQQFMNSQQLKILKPSATRWLALCNCVERILLMWDVLYEIFRLANFEKESDVAALIFNDMSNPVMKAYLHFLKFILSTFNKFNAFFQSEKNLIHLLYKECLSFLKSVALNFIKSRYVNDESILKINISHPEYLKPIEEVLIGNEARSLIINFEKSMQETFILNCVKFYQKAFQECLSRFPLNKLYQSFGFFNPTMALNVDAPIVDFNPLGDSFNLEKDGVLAQELIKIKTTFNETEKVNLRKLDVLEFWLHLKSIKNWNDEVILGNISELALTVLCLPHGNADVQRIFSLLNDMKTKKRNKLKPDTMTVLMRIRLDLMYKNCSCFSYPLNKEHFARLNKNKYRKPVNQQVDVDLIEDEDKGLYDD